MREPRNRNLKKTKKINSNDKFTALWSLSAIGISLLISLAILLCTHPSWLPGLASKLPAGPSLPFLDNKQNILLLGVDSNGKNSDPFDHTRSDSIIVLSIDPFGKTVNALSIPRDSKVQIADNNGIDKINAAHAFGGPQLTIKTIQQTFGIKIDHYIAVNYDAIRELVTILGGVPINVEKRMRYRDRTAKLNIDLYPGRQVLNAEQAEGYLRFRHDAIGDIGRMQRQQWFVRGLVEKLQSPEIVTKIPQLIDALSKYVRTDMNIFDLTKLAGYAKQVDFSKVQSATLPGKPSNRGHISYWILDAEKTQEIIDRLIYKTDAQITHPLTVSIVYAADKANEAALAKTAVEKAGFTVGCTNQNNFPHTQIMSHSAEASLKLATTFKKQIPSLEKAQFIISPNNYLCGKTDYTIVLSSQDR
ncbi:MAG: LCP family protein [bacterium]